eukprot:9307952-Lingulodinium_polyedra.AAC.1
MALFSNTLKSNACFESQTGHEHETPVSRCHPSARRGESRLTNVHVESQVVSREVKDEKGKIRRVQG